MVHCSRSSGTGMLSNTVRALFLSRVTLRSLSPGIFSFVPEAPVSLEKDDRDLLLPWCDRCVLGSVAESIAADTVGPYSQDFMGAARDFSVGPLPPHSAPARERILQRQNP